MKPIPKTREPSPPSTQYLSNRKPNEVDDYQAVTTNLPKIKQKLLMMQQSQLRPAMKSQVTHQRSQSQQDYQQLAKTNFYTAFNFNVLHSKQSEFENYNSPVKQLRATMHLGGGKEESSWTQSRSLIDVPAEVQNRSVVMQRSGGFEAFKFRPVHGLPLSQRDSSLELESTLKLKKFENLMTQPIQGKTTCAKSLKLIPLVKPPKIQKIIVESNELFDQNDSIEKAQMSTFTDNTTVENSHFQLHQSSILTYGFSKELDSKQLSVELTQRPVQIKQKQKKVIQQKEWQPPQIVSGRKQDQIENQTLKREAQLKRRLYFRQSSAKKRNETLGETLRGGGFVLNVDNKEVSEKSISSRSVSPTAEVDNRCLQKSRDEKYQQQLSDSMRPRLGHLLLRPETKDFQQNLGHYRFEQMLQNAHSDDDRSIINEAYQQFMKALRTQKEKSIKDRSETTQLEEDSDQSLILEEDGGPRIECKELVSNDKLLGNFVRAISKKLQKYMQKLGRDIENAEYHDRIRDLDISAIQAEFNIPKKLKEKRKPLVGDDQQQSALEQIYWKQDKFEKIARVNLQGLRDYTTLLEGTKFEQELEIKPTKIRRGFIILPGGPTDVEKINLEEMIDDPAILFDKYLGQKQESSRTLGQDFYEKYETARLSQSYNYNSVMLQENPTSKVAFIKTSNSLLELALPILAKIKHQELILSDYRLQIGHFQALKVAFTIEPDLVQKITLNNCGIDDSSITCLLEGCLLLESIQHIQVTKGEFGLRSVELLSEVLQKPSFQSLKLKDIELQPQTSELFFQTLGKINYLKYLSLSGFQFSDKSFDFFIEYFQKQQRLEELDLGNVSGLRIQNWTKFMQVLAHNKTLRDLDLSWNNLIENQDIAFVELNNPYKIFEKIYAKWLKMGSGAQWPGPDVLENIRKPKVDPKKTTGEGGKKCGAAPQFSEADGHDHIFDRYETNDIEEDLKQKLIFNVEKLMKQSIHAAVAIAFMKPIIAVKGRQPEPKPAPPLQMGNEPFEKASQQAAIVTEALYKFIRRDTNIQHLNLTGCNMSQVMMARIGVGIKCSSSLMAVHLSNNPGVTSAVKAFLQVKLKAAPPPPSETKISNHFMETDSKLKETMSEQLQTMKTEEQSLVHETVAIREINKKKHDCSYHPVDPIMAESKTLLFTRLLGHKFQLPGSGRWTIITDPKDECWICHKYVYSLFFWTSKQIADQQVPSSHMINKNKITKKLEISQEAGNPVIYAPFTNWHGQKMYSVEEFAGITRKPTPPDFIQMVKTLHGLPDKYEYFDLIPDHKQMVMELKSEYQSTCTDSWRQHIAGLNRFKDVQFVNYEHLDPLKFDGVFDDLISNPIYVYPAMAKPGKQYYIVQQNTFSEEEPVTLTSQDFYLHKAINPIREAPLPQVTKQLVQNEVIRVFHKDRSVFKPWKVDTVGSLSKCVDIDLEAMNISKFFKDAEEMARMVKVIKRNISYLKLCHLDLITTSSTPPFVTFLDFVNFYRTCKLDDENLKPASIDLIYVQVLTNCKTRTCINRGELIEALIRIAKAKYRDRGICQTLDESLQLLIEKNIKPTWGDSLWHQTRQKHFWNVEINDILEVNQEQLKKIFQLWWDLKGIVKKKWLEVKEADYFMTQKMPELKLTINTARQCYVMSKMTCCDEQTKVDQYNRMVFVEFLEMLCRMALYHYDETPMREWSLPQRLEHVVQNVLLIKGFERKLVIVETQVDSDADISDNDY